LGRLCVPCLRGDLWGLWQLGAHHDWTPPATRITDGSVAAIGKSLLTTYSLAFELISLALLIAIIGRWLSRRTGKDQMMTPTPLPDRPDLYFAIAALLLVIGIFGSAPAHADRVLISGELIFSGLR